MMKPLALFAALIAQCLTNIAAQTPFDSENCENCGPSGDFFCGTDEKCYAWNCQNWYAFGAADFTGHSGDGLQPTMTCENVGMYPLGLGPDALDYCGSNTSVPSSTLYDCSGYDCTDARPSASMGFTVQCLANHATATFACYEMASNTDYSDFLSGVQTSPVSCVGGDNQLLDAPEYLTFITVAKDTLDMGRSVVFASVKNSTIFNETIAQTAMFSHLRENPPTEAPTPTSGTFQLAIARYLVGLTLTMLL
jgi:hypothetical protein